VASASISVIEHAFIFSSTACIATSLSSTSTTLLGVEGSAFAKFENFKDLGVLEIGVGFASDHSQIALQNPKSLTSIDPNRKGGREYKDTISNSRFN
jgi:hypothetical protein